MTAHLADVARHLDDLLRVRDIPDYPNAINGVQVNHRGPVTRIATAVDASAAAIRGASDAGANLLVVHHGLFWGGVQPLTGHRYSRIRELFDHDIAVYSAHLPLDAHPEYGNSRLLADRLALVVSGGFAHYQGIACGVRGEADVATVDLLASADAFARGHGGRAIASPYAPGRRTRRWAICSGAGASPGILDEANAHAVDTLIVGEGPHWTAVDAPERDIVIIYAGHYATETLGVMAIGAHLSSIFQRPSTFRAAPTGL